MRFLIQNQSHDYSFLNAARHDQGGRFRMTHLVAFQTPLDLWCFSCDSNGIILQAFPTTMHRYIGTHIDNVSLIAASVMRYRVEEINDNEYPTSFEIIHDGTGRVVVKQSGLKMKFAEVYGHWNKETKSLDIHQIEDIPFYNEACTKCGIPYDLHLGPVDAIRDTLHSVWGDRNKCREFKRCDPPKAAYGTLGK